MSGVIPEAGNKYNAKQKQCNSYRDSPLQRGVFPLKFLIKEVHETSDCGQGRLTRRH
jgi:hypothetical protein